MAGVDRDLGPKSEGWSLEFRSKMASQGFVSDEGRCRRRTCTCWGRIRKSDAGRGAGYEIGAGLWASGKSDGLCAQDIASVRAMGPAKAKRSAQPMGRKALVDALVEQGSAQELHPRKKKARRAEASVLAWAGDVARVIACGLVEQRVQSSVAQAVFHGLGFPAGLLALTLRRTDRPAGCPTDRRSRRPSGGTSDRSTDRSTACATDLPSDRPSDCPTDQPPSDQPPSARSPLQPSDGPHGRPTIRPSEPPTDPLTDWPTVRPLGRPPDRPPDGARPPLRPTDCPTDRLARPTDRPTQCARPIDRQLVGPRAAVCSR